MNSFLVIFFSTFFFLVHVETNGKFRLLKIQRQLNFYVFYALDVQLYNMDNDCIRAILNKIRAIILE